jgi:hypothetical protein
MTTVNVDVSETGIRIVALEIRSREIATYMSAVPEEERPRALAHALKVGVSCLNRARAGNDLDFVKREVDGLLSGVQSALGRIPVETQKQLAAKIGTGEGQLLAPLQLLVQEVSKAASERVEGIRGLLQERVDPDKESSSHSRALRALRDLLDPRRSDSIQASLNAAVRLATSERGPLAKAVQDGVAESLKPLEEKVNDLTKEVVRKEVAAEFLDQTTKNGPTSEEEVVSGLQS